MREKQKRWRRFFSFKTPFVISTKDSEKENKIRLEKEIGEREQNKIGERDWGKRREKKETRVRE
jgi:hypothetical protein